jgi:hypothetical protein
MAASMESVSCCAWTPPHSTPTSGVAAFGTKTGAVGMVDDKLRGSRDDGERLGVRRYDRFTFGGSTVTCGGTAAAGNAVGG